MRSSLYECRILHQRFSPRHHRFLYRIFLFAIDLDELGTLGRKLPMFSVDRANLYSFRNRDFFPFEPAAHHRPRRSANSGETPLVLKERVVAFLADRGIALNGGRVVLITLPRVFGYLFNPVSFYFCYNEAGQRVAAIAEVTNTFKEMKLYFLGPKTFDDAKGEFRFRIPKFFYVSPYSDVDAEFDFTLRSPGENLSVQIDDYVGPTRTLTSVLSGTRHELTAPRLAWWTVKYPLITLKVITLIHWHALLLWLKRVRWFPKAGRPADQRELYRPHFSIAPAQPAKLP